MRRRTLIIAATLAAILAAGLYWGVFLRREHGRWTQIVELADGTQARAEIESSAQVYWSFGHAGGLGGGDQRYRVEVETAGRRFTWTGGDERPMTVGMADGKLYLAVFDRGDMARLRYRYYRSGPDDRLCEIRPDEFPKALALQNVGVVPEDAALLRAMDGQDYWFRRSLTARMWLHLEMRRDYFESEAEGAGPSPEFVAAYKAKYMRGAGAGPAPGR